MKAISLWQPWASLMVSQHKRYETRHWAISFRGNIAVHAAKKWDSENKHYIQRLIRQFPNELADYAITPLPLGCIIGAFRLIDIHTTESIRDNLSPLELALGDYSNGRYAWEMELIKIPEKPIPAKGMQGIFEWSLDNANA